VATSFEKNDKSSRRALAADVRSKQARAERRKSLSIVGACVFVALLIIGAAAYNPIKNWWDLRQFRGVDLAAIGAPATVCTKPITKEASASQQHVPEGSTIDYTDAPPAFGQHYPVPDPMERKLYTADDRPALGNLVHNLEHGYSILWYDQTVADDSKQMSELRGIADKLQGTGNLRTKFKAVPWLSTDENGKKFPDGQHVAITHWSAGGTGDQATGKPVGVWQYCSAVSGAALKTFMLDYPYLDSPEPGAA
jgi:hypothetical protein